MTTSILQEQLEKIYPVYQAIRQSQERLADLQTVEKCRLEYQQILMDEENQIAKLKQQKQELIHEKDRLNLPKQQRPSDPFIFTLPVDDDIGYPKPIVRSPVPPIIIEPKPSIPDNRRKLKNLVNRWHNSWGLDTIVLGQFNSIIDHSDKPLGEALVLLDWSIFADPVLTGAKPEDHLNRLTEWGEALNEYYNNLKTEIELRESRYQGWLGIWAKWRDQDHSSEHQQEWQNLVEATKQSKLAEIAKLNQEIDQIKQEISQLKAITKSIGE